MPNFLEYRKSQMNPTAPSTSGYPTFRKGKKNQNLNAWANYMGEQGAGATGQTADMYALMMQRLMDPTGGAQAYMPFFTNAIQAAAQPMIEQAGRDRMKLSANVASRFGGNVGTEEFRAVGTFDEQLSEAIARMASQAGPNAIQAAQTGTGQAMQGYGMAGARESDIRSQILSALAGQTQEGGWFGKFLGTLANTGLNIATSRLG